MRRIILVLSSAALVAAIDGIQSCECVCPGGGVRPACRASVGINGSLDEDLLYG